MNGNNYNVSQFTTKEVDFYLRMSLRELKNLEKQQPGILSKICISCNACKKGTGCKIAEALKDVDKVNIEDARYSKDFPER